MRFPFFSRLCAIVLLSGLAAASAADAPTPYPDSKDTAAWPGRGPIRLHPWMADNRASFWTKREKDRGAVVFVGSSMIGNWKTLAADFPALKVANRGIGGDVSRGLLFRFKEDVLDLDPRALVLAIGSNDLSAHADPAVIAENVSAIIDLARAHNPALPIVLCPVAPRQDPKAPLKPGALDAYNALIAELGARKNAAVPDLRTPFVTPDGELIRDYYRADLIHLTPAGYAQLTKAVAASLARLGVK
jgi:lysophospholipase L1-like esterase